MYVSYPVRSTLYAIRFCEGDMATAPTSQCLDAAASTFSSSSTSSPSLPSPPRGRRQRMRYDFPSTVRA